MLPRSSVTWSRSGGGSWPRRQRAPGIRAPPFVHSAGLLGIGGRLAQGRGRSSAMPQGGVTCSSGTPGGTTAPGCRGAAGGVLRQLRPNPSEGFAAAPGCGHALRAQLDGGPGGAPAAGRGAHAAFQPHIAAQRGLAPPQGEAGVRENCTTPARGSGRRVGVMRTSLPASVTLPLHLDLSFR